MTKKIRTLDLSEPSRLKRLLSGDKKIKGPKTTFSGGIISKMKKLNPLKIKKRTILFLGDKYLSYGDNTGTIKLQLTDDLVQDLEIIDNEKLFKVIRFFIENSNLTKTSLLMVLDDSLFFEYIFDNQTDIETQTNKLIENAPFEKISFKLVNDEKQSKMLVTNRNFFIPIKEAFESEGFKITLALPYSMLKKLKLDLNKIIDNEKSTGLTQKLNSLEKYNLLSDSTETKQKKQNKSTGSKYPKISRRRPAILLSILTMLVIILITMLVVKRSVPSFRADTFVTGKIALVSPTSPPNSVTNSEKTLQTTNIKVLYNSKNLNSATTLKNTLVQQGFKIVSIDSNKENGDTPKTFVVFSLKFPVLLKEKIINSVNKIFIDVSTQESNMTSPDVLITVGNAF